MICVVGAPRCGTTSLSTWLREHPDICFSYVKEPHFFTQFDLTRCSTAELRRRVERDYLLRYFPDRESRGSVLAEGSVSYLYAAERMEPILRLWPDARFVIALRDPMALLPSLHLRLRYIGDEVEESFERAWSLVGERREGRQVPRSCIDPRFLDYDEIARLGKHVGRFLAAVGPERCFISLFDDLAAEPGAIYRDMLRFLDLPYHPRSDFSAVRASRGFRIGTVQRFLKRPPRRAAAMLGGEKLRRRVSADPDAGMSWPVRAIMAARKRIIGWNSVEAAPSDIPLRLRIQIRATLREDVKSLARLIGRNLDHWLSSGFTLPRRDRSRGFAAAGGIQPLPSSRERKLPVRRPAPAAHGPVAHPPFVGEPLETVDEH